MLDLRCPSPEEEQLRATGRFGSHENGQGTSHIDVQRPHLQAYGHYWPPKKTLKVRYWKSGSRKEALTFPYWGNDTSWRYSHQWLSKKGLLKTGHVYEALDNWFWHKNWSSEKNAGLATYANPPLWISIYRINTVLDPLEIVSGLTSIIPYKFLKGKSNG